MAAPAPPPLMAGELLKKTKNGTWHTRFFTLYAHELSWRAPNSSADDSSSAKSVSLSSAGEWTVRDIQVGIKKFMFELSSSSQSLLLSASGATEKKAWLAQLQHVCGGGAQGGKPPVVPNKLPSAAAAIPPQPPVKTSTDAILQSLASTPMANERLAQRMAAFTRPAAPPSAAFSPPTTSASTSSASKCSKCHAGVLSLEQVRDVMGKGTVIHRRCFVCAQCHRGLTQATFGGLWPLVKEGEDEEGTVRRILCVAHFQLQQQQQQQEEEEEAAAAHASSSSSPAPEEEEKAVAVVEEKEEAVAVAVGEREEAKAEETTTAAAAVEVKAAEETPAIETKVVEETPAAIEAKVEEADEAAAAVEVKAEEESVVAAEETKAEETSAAAVEPKETTTAAAAAVESKEETGAAKTEEDAAAAAPEDKTTTPAAAPSGLVSRLRRLSGALPFASSSSAAPPPPPSTSAAPSSVKSLGMSLKINLGAPPPSTSTSAPPSVKSLGMSLKINLGMPPPMAKPPAAASASSASLDNTALLNKPTVPSGRRRKPSMLPGTLLHQPAAAFAAPTLLPTFQESTDKATSECTFKARFEDGQVLCMHASSTLERDAWVAALCNVVQLLELERQLKKAQLVDMLSAMRCQIQLEEFSARTPPEELNYTGFLEKLSVKSQRNWKRRWFELTQRGEFKYSQDEGKKPKHQFQLTSATQILTGGDEVLSGN